MYTENCTKKSFFITKIRLDTVPRTILCSLDVRLTHKNIIVLVASEVKIIKWRSSDVGHDHQLRADVELTSHVLLRTP